MVIIAAIATVSTSFVVGEAGIVSAAPASSTVETSEQKSAAAQSGTAATASTALSPSAFNPGLIISDALFFDNSAMTLAEIQSFLSAKVGSCANAYCLAGYMSASTSKGGDTWCAPYAGSASESAASIIFKVQRACGVSARAILVTLQKEQGLVTKSAPTSGTIRIAMGYGCPDTAACDSTYYGFFNQVYQAARQLKRYGQPGTSFNWYPLGVTTAVRYHPNAACGAKPVLIQNRATAALYYYTPYTPNAAALNNLYGTGDACSSYGNRNFWRFFNEWFGNSLAGAGDAAITAIYNLNKAQLGDVVQPSGSCGTRLACHQRYQNGAIYWMAAQGAFAITGAYWTEFSSHGASLLGYPTGNPVTVAGGSGMSFQRGTIYSSAAGTFTVANPLRAVFWAKGSVGGSLGWPKANQTCSGAICSQPFQGGVVFSNGTTGQVLVGDDYIDAFTRAGGLSALGMPVAAKVNLTDSPHGDGSGQTFTSGTIFSSDHGTYAVVGDIKTKYSSSRIYKGDLGWPTGDRECTSRNCVQAFENGTIFSAASTGVRIVMDDYLDVWTGAGGLTMMGLPTIDEVVVTTPTNGNGSGQTFENGTIYTSSAGTFAVIRPLRELYFSHGGNKGSYGWPTGAQTCAGNECSQRFQHGVLKSTNPYNTIYKYWLGTGGPSGPLGSPVGAVVTLPENGGGFGQSFSKGTIYSSAAGTFAVLVPLRTEYVAHGRHAGPVGWPIAEQKCASGECTQTFQRGTIFSSTARGGRTVVGEFNTLYAAGSSGLGVPLADQVDLAGGANGNGTGQSFVNGTIYKGPTGAFAVLRPIRDAYGSGGSYKGAIGWPTKAQVCDGADCYQEFQGALIFSNGAGSWSVTGAFAAAYRAAGGWSVLGGARSNVVAVTTASNGNGSGQIFARGTIYSSASGTFALTSGARSEYMAIGGNSGPAGWPTSARTCESGECVQTFQGAVIFESDARGARALSGDFLTEFTRVGGVAVLGVPTGRVVQITGNPNGDGAGQVFVNGTIYTSAAGTFAVLKPLRDAYFAAGGNSGSYGWPVGPQTCAADVCSQEFQGGTITT